VTSTLVARDNCTARMPLTCSDRRATLRFSALARQIRLASWDQSGWVNFLRQPINERDV
jgi:hypothetical protein